MCRNVSVLMLAAVLFVGLTQVSAAQTPAQIVEDRQDAMEKNWTNYFKPIAGRVTLRQARILPSWRQRPPRRSITSKSSRSFFHREPAATSCRKRAQSPKSGHSGRISTLRSTALVDATKTIGDDAKKGDVEKVKADWTAVAKACGACHGGPTDAGGKFRFAKGE